MNKTTKLTDVLEQYLCSRDNTQQAVRMYGTASQIYKDALYALQRDAEKLNLFLEERQ